MITLLVTLLLSIDVFFCFVFFPLRDVNRAKAILCSTYMYLDSLVMEGSKLEYFPHQYFRKNGILEFKKNVSYGSLSVNMMRLSRQCHEATQESQTKRYALNQLVSHILGSYGSFGLNTW